MHRNGIIGALWTAARQLGTARRGIRIAVSLLLAGGVITAVSAGRVEYDYTGSAFTSITCTGDCTANAPTASQSISGNVVVDSAFGSSASISGPNILSYSFTDGVNTISSSTPGATFLAPPFFQTN